jgi:hypothetical protein
MTRDEAREFVKIVQAYADGKEIQHWSLDRKEWLDEGDDASLHSWMPHRIKPEPREWWVVLDCNMGGVNYKYSTQEAAAASAEKLSRTCSLAPYTVFTSAR